MFYLHVHAHLPVYVGPWVCVCVYVCVCACGCGSLVLTGTLNNPILITTRNTCYIWRFLYLQTAGVCLTSLQEAGRGGGMVGEGRGGDSRYKGIYTGLFVSLYTIYPIVMN